jgi:aspartyl-tRNA(Asn)/glutamyl-tRNA(Gln) amidotransferase subunit C
MKINVPHVAKLANLTLNTAEIKKFEKQLQNVLDYIEKLNEVKTEKVEETSQTTGLENVFREDEVEANNCLSQDEALFNTKSAEKGFIKVKGVFDE